MGAVAGTHGVAIFSMDELHKPLMMLNRALPTAVSLAFSSSTDTEQQQQSSQQQHNLLLASAQGNGILVWDVSGQRLSPLWGRLGMDSRASIVSLAWYPGPLVAAATENALATWDLRSNQFHPSLRFGVRQKGETACPYIQITGGTKPHECAVLDARGVLRIYDMRIADRPSSSSGALHQFSVLAHAGVGIASMDSGWLAWGLDEPEGDMVVKVWSCDGDDASSHRLLGTIARPHLACARVCPAPVESSFVTVSFQDDTTQSQHQQLHWNAELWKVTAQGLERTLSFRGGAEMDRIQSATPMGTLCAAELAVQREKENAGVRLCTLTEKGFLASYVSGCM